MFLGAVLTPRKDTGKTCSLRTILLYCIFSVSEVFFPVVEFDLLKIVLFSNLTKI